MVHILMQVVGCRGKAEIALRGAMLKEVTVQGVYLGRSSQVIRFISVAFAHHILKKVMNMSCGTVTEK